ncbi:winged helix-turn-helix domain-containing protein [bacterium]|nr:winged helix-turn-helix domain-containing protein [bacterium]
MIESKKKQMFDRTIKIIETLIVKEGLSGKEIAKEIGESLAVAHQNCNRMVKAGIIETSKEKSGYFLKKGSIKVGHIFRAMNMPILELGIEEADKRFNNYLQTEVLHV